MAEGRATLGYLVTTPSVQLIQALARSGVDWLMLDRRADHPSRASCRALGVLRSIGSSASLALAAAKPPSRPIACAIAASSLAWRCEGDAGSASSWPPRVASAGAAILSGCRRRHRRTSSPPHRHRHASMKRSRSAGSIRTSRPGRRMTLSRPASTQPRTVQIDTAQRSAAAWKVSVVGRSYRPRGSGMSQLT